MKNVTDTATIVGGIAVGGAASRAVASLIEEQMPDKSLLVKAGIATVALIVGAAYSGNAFVKNTFVGMSVVQGLDAIKEAVGRSQTGQELATSPNKVKRLAASALGLACPCDAPMYALPSQSLRSVALVEQAQYLNSSNPFEV